MWSEEITRAYFLFDKCKVTVLLVPDLNRCQSVVWEMVLPAYTSAQPPLYPRQMPLEMECLWRVQVLIWGVQVVRLPLWRQALFQM
jgi:hypothetical protein